MGWIVIARMHAAPPPLDPTPISCRTLSRSGPPSTDVCVSTPLTGPPRGLVDRAANVFVDLCAGAPRVLLHGDLHHDNILRSGREGWLAIGPFGVFGDPGFEAGALLYNPIRSGTTTRYSASCRPESSS